jgi:hypothetical protein
MPAKKPTAKTSTKSSAIKDVEAVEIKVTIRPDQELQGLRALKLDEDSAEVRVIYFYDTRKLDLFKAGVVFRTRLVRGDADDSTVKIRPVTPGKIPGNWSKTKGFKIEADRTGNRVVCSASLTERRKRSEIDEVAEGKRSIEKLFSKNQLQLVGDLYSKPVNFKLLRSMGPIRVLCWTIVHKGFPYKLTSEEWRLPDGEDLLEVSIKVKPAEAAKAQKAFEGHLRELGLDAHGAQETKTRTALEYFSRLK